MIYVFIITVLALSNYAYSSQVTSTPQSPSWQLSENRPKIDIAATVRQTAEQQAKTAQILKHDLFANMVNQRNEILDALHDLINKRSRQLQMMIEHYNRLQTSIKARSFTRHKDAFALTDTIGRIQDDIRRTRLSDYARPEPKIGLTNKDQVAAVSESNQRIDLLRQMVQEYTQKLNKIISYYQTMYQTSSVNKLHQEEIDDMMRTLYSDNMQATQMRPFLLNH